MSRDGQQHGSGAARAGRFRLGEKGQAMPQSMPVLKKPAPQPKAGRSRRLIAILILLFLAVLAVLFFRSPLSRIENVSVSGQQYIGADAIREAAGIGGGDPFFYPSGHAIAERIRARIRQIDTVAVEKKFPGDVHITVKEYPAVAFEHAANGDITAILANGTSIGGKDRAFVVDKPVLTGWREDDPVKAQLTKQLASLPSGVLSDFSEIMPFPSKSYQDRIKIYTRTGFEVITAVSLLPEKAETLSKVIAKQEPGRVTMLLTDRYVPFRPHPEENEDGTQKDSTQPH